MFRRGAFGLVVMMVLAAGVSFAAEKEAPKPTLDDLDFIAGCWEGDLGDGATIRETFTSPRGGAMLGNSQMVAGGATRFFEMVRIVEDASGIAYHPSFNGQKEPVKFPLAKLTETEAVFENPEHDYPQRIVYSSPAKGQLAARIELMSGEKAQGFMMKAVPCGGKAYQSALN